MRFKTCDIFPKSALNCAIAFFVNDSEKVSAANVNDLFYSEFFSSIRAFLRFSYDDIPLRSMNRFLNDVAYRNNGKILLM